MITLREEMAKVVCENIAGCTTPNNPKFYTDISDKLLSLILKHIEEKLTVIGDDEVRNLLADDCMLRESVFPPEAQNKITSQNVYQWVSFQDVRLIKNTITKELRHTLSQIKEILK